MYYIVINAIIILLQITIKRNHSSTPVAVLKWPNHHSTNEHCRIYCRNSFQQIVLFLGLVTEQNI